MEQISFEQKTPFPTHHKCNGELKYDLNRPAKIQIE